jgi:hypothetical protein
VFSIDWSDLMLPSNFPYFVPQSASPKPKRTAAETISFTLGRLRVILLVGMGFDSFDIFKFN